MQLQFKNLSIQGFKSFKKEQTFSFTDYNSGLLFLTGKNLAEPDLEGNAAGKSTIWDALTWVLYGKTTRGTKAATIKNWNSKRQCKVELTFSLAGNEYHLLRTWKPNALKLTCNDSGSKIVTQDELESLILLNYKSFLQAVVLGQFSDMFLDLPVSAKSELFTEILDLSLWVDLSVKAKEEYQELNDGVDELSSKVGLHKSILQELKQQDYKLMYDSWEKERIAKEEQAGGLLTQYKAKLSKKLAVFSGIKSVRALLEEKLEKKNTRLKKSQKGSDTLYEEINKRVLKESVLERDLVSITKEIQKYKHVGDNCPYCKQAVSADYIEVSVADLENSVTVVKDKIKKLNKDTASLVDDRDVFIKKNLKIESKIDNYETKISELVAELSECKDVVSDYTNKVSSAVGALEKIQKEENPFTEIHDKQQRGIKVLKSKIKTKNKKIKKLIVKRDATKYWIDGFKHVRLFIINEALLQFEVEVNNCLINLGLKDWSITFDVDRETKSGTIQKGFTVLINSPHNDEPVAWEAWSGGESQRLRLAANMGLSNLIFNRLGMSVNIEVWDEPSNYLSRKGISDLLDVLKTRSRDLKKQVWIVDHRSLSYGDFEKTVTVVKTKKGSKIQ